jgi:hypothetical protein
MKSCQEKFKFLTQRKIALPVGPYFQALISDLVYNYALSEPISYANQGCKQ